MRSRLPILIALVASLLAGCTSLDEHIGSARAADQAALEAGAGSQNSIWVVVAHGEVWGAETEEEALLIHATAPHRFVFQRGNAGDTRPRMAYLPTAALIAGQEFAAALGLKLRRNASGRAILTRDTRRIAAEPGGTIIVHVEAPDGGDATAAAILLDPGFQGPLLVSPSVAERMGLRRFEIPGTARVDVALGRPFSARRARLRVTIERLGVNAAVETLFPE